MSFPTKEHWFNSVWPDYEAGGEILVPVHRHTDLEEVGRTVEGEPNTKFLLLVEDFDHFNDNMPASWRRMSSLGGGGIPSNVWVGAGISSQKEADERMRRLVKIRARVLFILLKKNHNQSIDLKPGLIAWRCQNCGRRDGYGRMKRPEECPTGSICEGAKLGPQIHWVVSMEEYESDARAKRCARLGVAFWDGKSLEVPE
jgi:hypothetical protein